MCEQVARFHSAIRIDCYVALVDMPNDAFFVDHARFPKPWAPR